MTTPTPTDAPVVTEPAPLVTAAGLAEAGAAPIVPDVNALMEQIQKMQARLDAMSVAAGVPADPIAAAVKDVKDHVNARMTANPGLREAFAEIWDTVTSLSDSPTSSDTDLLRTIIDEFIGYVEGLDYVRQLANKLHKLVLKG